MAVLKSPARAWRFLKSGFDWYVGFQAGLTMANLVFITAWAATRPIGILTISAFVALATWSAWNATAAFSDNRKVRAARREIDKAWVDDRVATIYRDWIATANALSPTPTNGQWAAGSQPSGYQVSQLRAQQAQLNYISAMATGPTRMLTRTPSGGYTYSAVETATAIPQRPTASVDSLPKESALIRGWRTYTVNEQGQLKGSRAVWESATFEAKCSGQEVVADHLLNGCIQGGYPHTSFECGIYSHKTGPEYLNLERLDCHNFAPVTVVAQCISSGVVAEHEFGYRAEKCRIEQMWLVVPRGCGKHPLALRGESKTEIIWDQWANAYHDAVTGEPVALPKLSLVEVQRVGGELGRFIVQYPHHWACAEGEAVANPGAAYAQVLSTKYGVPCTAIGVAEFLAKLDEGSL